MSLFSALKDFKREYIDNAKPPRDADHEWIHPDKMRKYEQDRKARIPYEDYCEDHYFDILNECWVKEYPSGDCVRSCSYEDLKAGRPDDQGPINVGYLIPADEYCDDPEWLEEKQEHWHQWTSLMRDDEP